MAVKKRRTRRNVEWRMFRTRAGQLVKFPISKRAGYKPSIGDRKRRKKR